MGTSNKRVDQPLIQDGFQPELLDADTSLPVFPEVDEYAGYSAMPRNHLLSLLNVNAPTPTLALIPHEGFHITFLSRKLFRLLMYFAQQQGPEQRTYRVRLSDVIVGSSFESRNTLHLKRTFLRLMKTTVTWQSPTTRESETWVASTMLGHAGIVKRGHDVWVEWSYSNFMHEAIHSPNPYVRLCIEMYATLSKTPSLALYENSVRYVDFKFGMPLHHWTWWRPVLTGKSVSESGGAYEEWKYFKRDVINPAVAEVNEKSDIHVEPDLVKRGKNVEKLRFIVEKKSNFVVNSNFTLSKPKPINFVALDDAVKLGINENTAQDLLNQYGDDAFEKAVLKLALRNKLAESGKVLPIQHPTSYLKTCLKNPELSDAPTSRPVGVIAQATRLLVTPVQSTPISYRAMQVERIRELINAMTASELRQMEEKFEQAGFPGAVMTKASEASWLSKRSKAGGQFTVAFPVFVACDIFGPQWDVEEPASEPSATET